MRKAIHNVMHAGAAIFFAANAFMTIMHCVPAVAAETADAPPAMIDHGVTVWNEATNAATRELANSASRFRPRKAEQFTLCARIMRSAGMKSSAFIARTPGWEFGIQADGALYFGFTKLGKRNSTAFAEVAPLWVQPNGEWPPTKAHNGLVPAGEWIDVAWTVNMQGNWNNALGLYINGIAVPISMGMTPIAQEKEGAVQIGGGTDSGLQIEQMRIFPRLLSRGELATGTASPTQAAPAAPPVKPAAEASASAMQTGMAPLVIAHRMLGFGPDFGGARNPADRSNGAYGFLFPVKIPGGADLTGYSRDGHIGALHPPFESGIDACKWEIAQAMAAGVDAFVFDTCGGTHEIGVPDLMIRAAEELGGTFKIGLCFDYAGGSIEKKIESLQYWLKNHRTSPSLLRLQGKPAFISYMSHRKPEEVRGWFDALRTAAGEPVYLHHDLCEFPNFGQTEGEWDAAAQPYLAAADGYGCFYSRRGFETDTRALTELAAAVHRAGKLWGFSPWPNYYSPGRSAGMENIGADNSRLFDRMWKLGRDTKADYILITTWNDITEETIVMPSVRKHFSFCDLLANYYIPWFKTGQEPAAPRDQVYVFYRPYRTDAAAPLIAGPRARSSATQNVVEVRTFLTSPGRIELSGAGARDVPAGMHSEEFPARPGAVTLTLTRPDVSGSKPLLRFTAPERITDRPWREDFALRGFSSEEAAHWAAWFPGPANYISEYGDFDANGLPNWFERYYFGRWQGTDPNADPDADGRNNLQEYQAGSDPQRKPVAYADGFVWSAAHDFRADNETYPLTDKKGTKVWEFEFLPRTGHPALPRTEIFAPARLLVRQIPAWLEWPGSWHSGIGAPEGEIIRMFGEADTTASIVFTAPLSGTLRMHLKIAPDEKLPALTQLQCRLRNERTGETVLDDVLQGGDDPLISTRDFPVKPGDRLRLEISGQENAPRWNALVEWNLRTVSAVSER